MKTGILGHTRPLLSLDLWVIEPTKHPTHAQRRILMAASARPQRSHHSLVLRGKKGKRPMCGVKESPRRCGHRTAGPAHASGLQQSSATRRAVAVALVARRRLVAAEARALLPAVASCRRNLALCPARLVRRRGGDPLLVVAGKRRSCSQPAPIKRRRSRAPRHRCRRVSLLASAASGTARPPVRDKDTHSPRLMSPLHSHF